MANSENKKGHTDIPHEYLEKLCLLDLTGAEFRVLLYIIRKIWGWNKRQDAISLTQLEKGTGLARKTIIECANSLVDRGILHKCQEKRVNIYQIEDNCNLLASEPRLTSYRLNACKKKALSGLDSYPGVTSEPFLPISGVASEPGVTSEFSAASEPGVTIDSEPGVTTPKNVTGVASEPGVTYKYTKATITNTSAHKILEMYNRIFKRQLTATDDFEDNLEFWLNRYSMEQIEEAFENAYADKYWRENMTPTIMLRKKNQNREKVNRIEEMLNRKCKKPVFQDFKPPQESGEISEEIRQEVRSTIDLIKTGFNL